jgi:very-short-patch-repair endonuclease
MSTKSVRRNPTPSPLAGEGWDGGGTGMEGKAVSVPPPHSSPAKGEEGEKSSSDGKKYARLLRRRPTEAEQAPWRHLRLRQIAGYKFRRQQPLGPYVVDLVCLEARLIIEIDGGQHATSTNDAKRTAWLESNGFWVMRFWNHEVMAATDAVVTAIEHALKSPPPGGRKTATAIKHQLKHPPHLYPPPPGGRKSGTTVRGSVSA